MLDKILKNKTAPLWLSLSCSSCLSSSQRLSVQKVSWGQRSDGRRDELVSPINESPRSLVSDLLRFPHLPGQRPLPRPLHGEAEGRGVPPPGRVILVQVPGHGVSLHKTESWGRGVQGRGRAGPLKLWVFFVSGQECSNWKKNTNKGSLQKTRSKWSMDAIETVKLYHFNLMITEKKKDIHSVFFIHFK